LGTTGKNNINQIISNQLTTPGNMIRQIIHQDQQQFQPYKSKVKSALRLGLDNLENVIDDASLNLVHAKIIKIAAKLSQLGEVITEELLTDKLKSCIKSSSYQIAIIEFENNLEMGQPMTMKEFMKILLKCNTLQASSKINLNLLLQDHQTPINNKFIKLNDNNNFQHNQKNSIISENILSSSSSQDQTMLELSKTMAKMQQTLYKVTEDLQDLKSVRSSRNDRSPSKDRERNTYKPSSYKSEYDRVRERSRDRNNERRRNDRRSYSRDKDQRSKRNERGSSSYSRDK